MRQKLAVSFNSVTKNYFKGGKYQPTFREWFDAIFSGKHFQRARFLALDNVSFKIKKGEVVGFIGSNGAGKSTILKLVSKVTSPNLGQVETNGTIAGLLELGAGFHPELSGTENIELYGSILGLSKKQIKLAYPEIAKFSEIEDFFETPVKHYSSGMMARLGFAIAINVHPDILLIDEVLAVGDISFQKKCILFIKKYCSNPNHTVLLVSHDVKSVVEICDRAIWIEHGKVMYDGDSKTAVQKFKLAQGTL